MATKRKAYVYGTDTTRHPWPHVTEDGLTWLDPEGNPAKIDADGKLMEPFTLETSIGSLERWAVGCRLPDTPEAFRRYAAGVAEKRARIVKPKDRR